jgi:tetratricopeptide (TPR) repeat protein
MATLLSRTIKRLAGSDTARPPLQQAELRELVDSARKLMAEGGSLEAQRVLVRAVDSNPDEAQVLTLYGVASFQAGDPAEARKALTRAVKIDPDDLIASKFLVYACNALGDSAGVVVGALNALRLAPSDREVLNLYGVACMNLGRFDAAADSFGKVVEMAPTDLTALVNIDSLSVRSLRHRRTLERSPKIATARTQAINRLRAQQRRGRLDDEGLSYLLMLLVGAPETFPSAIELAREVTTPARLSPARCRPGLGSALGRKRFWCTRNRASATRSSRCVSFRCSPSEASASTCGSSRLWPAWRPA